MANFLDKFPLIRYTVDKKLLSEYDTARNLLFRVRVIKEIMNTNLNTYYKYTIKDEETPDDLADKVYGTSEAHWIILYANDIYDPQYDWPMSNRVFDKYIKSKYGSMEFAKTNYHHYEKVITRENPFAQKTSVTTFEVNEEILTDDLPSVPMDSYDTLTDTTDFSTYEVDGKTVFETISRNRVTYYDYELQLNENRRLIKIIQPRYYQQIVNELELLVNTPPNYFRRP
jgi:hypothetical protein